MKNINSRIVFFIILSFTSDIHAEVTKLVCNYDDNFTVENYKINLVNKKIIRHDGDFEDYKRKIIEELEE